MDDMYPGLSAVVVCVLLTTVGVQSTIFARQDASSALRSVQKVNINDARQLLLRQRRDTKASVLTTEVVLQATEDHSSAFVHWAGKLKSEAVFVLTLKFTEAGVTDSLLWRSLDYGTTYSKIDFGKDSMVSYFYVSPADNTKMIFVDGKNKKRAYATTDESQHNHTITLPASSAYIYMHPTKSDWLLLRDFYQRDLYVSMDFGATWTLLYSDVNTRLSWGVSPYDKDEIVHLEYQPHDSEQAYYVRCTIPFCNATGDGINYDLGPFMPNNMLVIDEFIFVQKGSLDEEHSHMMVSHERNTFTNTYFPNTLRTNDFLILKADEGQVFVAVNHGDRAGVSLYLSDPTGQYFVESLTDVHHSALPSWSSVDVDMHEVKGLNGTYLANLQLSSSSSTQQQLKTMISFDKGGHWSDLNNQTACGKDPLLLRLDMASYMQDWILSEERAPGLLIAHGHCGRSYEQNISHLSVFTSMDGGWTWTKAPMTGVHHFNILDQGSIITAIKTSNQEPTNTIWYTTNGGLNWSQDKFHAHEISVNGVLNEVDINTLTVSVYGHENAAAPWTMIKLDFSNILTKKCVDADFQNWSPSDHDTTRGENCILGQETLYKMRKSESSTCYYGEDFVREISKKNCSCTREDFECDFGYREQGAQCVRESWYDDAYIAPTCTENQTFKKSRGYRKVASDKCTGGVEGNTQYAPADAKCPLVAPDHLLLVANDTIVSTGSGIHFHLSQKQGSIHTTTYRWNFNETGSSNPTLTGLDKGQQQVYSYSQSGVYYVTVTATNANGTSTSNVLKVTVEDSVHHVGLFSTWAAQVGFPVFVGVSTNLRSKADTGSLHFLFHFGDEESEVNDKLTWNTSVSHVYTKPGTYSLSTTAVNSISARSAQQNIRIIDNGVMLQVGFSPNVDSLVQSDVSFNSAEWIFFWLDNMRQELASMLAVSRDRIAVNLNTSMPVIIDILVVPPPSDAPDWELNNNQIVSALFEMVGNRSLVLFRSMGLPKSMGDITITSIRVLKSGGGGGGGGSDKKTGANYRAVYIAIPIVLLTAIVTTLVLVYYRKRFRDLRRYSMINQHEEADALLDDDDDEPPLDLRPDNRDESRDDGMLDLGTGSHLVMVTGSGGGDSSENC